MSYIFCVIAPYLKMINTNRLLINPKLFSTGAQVPRGGRQRAGRAGRSGRGTTAESHDGKIQQIRRVTRDERQRATSHQLLGQVEIENSPDPGSVLFSNQTPLLGKSKKSCALL